MVQLVVGQKGKGKTTEILMRANEEIKTATGNIVFLDRNSAHMYELNNRIRLIDVSRYPIRNRIKRTMGILNIRRSALQFPCLRTVCAKRT